MWGVVEHPTPREQGSATPPAPLHGDRCYEAEPLDGVMNLGLCLVGAFRGFAPEPFGEAVLFLVSGLFPGTPVGILKGGFFLCTLQIILRKRFVIC